MDDNIEVISVDENTNSISISKLMFPHLKKFMSNEYKDICKQLNECVIATNIAYKYYAAKTKSISLQSKLYTSLYHPTNGLFSYFKLLSNSKPIGNMP